MTLGIPHIQELAQAHFPQELTDLSVTRVVCETTRVGNLIPEVPGDEVRVLRHVEQVNLALTPGHAVGSHDDAAAAFPETREHSKEGCFACAVDASDHEAHTLLYVQGQVFQQEPSIWSIDADFVETDFLALIVLHGGTLLFRFLGLDSLDELHHPCRVSCQFLELFVDEHQVRQGTRSLLDEYVRLVVARCEIGGLGPSLGVADEEGEDDQRHTDARGHVLE
mmetsp:Transcript_30085/g.58900  ORF Transcript_30085/g.58900 Transcript_30085/m.58900 type:complete len:223 (+) Transcript_30085:294-962(+)